MQLAKDATSTIPIVFFSGDPVEAGLVASLARPGGNLTGVSDMNVELLPKRFELLSELAPQARVMGLLVYSNSPSAERIISEVQAAARAKGVEILILKVSSEIEIDAAFETLVQRQAGALLIGPDAFFFIRRDRLAALTARHAVPAIFGPREFPVAGGLASYGASLTAINRQLGIYVGRILKGEKPADLPVRQRTTFELVVNLKDRQGTWPHRPAIDPRPRRRGHRVRQRMAAVGRTSPFSGKAGGSGLGSSRQLASAPLPDPPIKLADLPVQR